MNAMVRGPHFTDDALCWQLSQLPPGVRIKDLARTLGLSEPAMSLRVSKLKLLGFVEYGRGSTKLTAGGEARARVVGLTAGCDSGPPTTRSPGASEADHLSAAAGRAAVVAPPSGTGRKAPGDSLEPRGSNPLPPMPLMIEALAGQQDALLARANELLQRRVRELEAEVADLKDQRAKALQRLGFVCDALTG